jgi:hypothetical protein
MKKTILGLGLATLITSSSFAMEMMATDTMMKHDDMKASGTMMMDKKMDDKMMIKDTMTKCIDAKKATRAEVRKFQRENGISATGFVGKMTKAKLTKMNCGKDAMMMKKDGAMMDDKMMKATDTMMKHN